MVARAFVPYPYDLADRWGITSSLTGTGGLSMINLDYPVLLDLFRHHIAPKRSESASFLIWYLENYYRLEEQEAVDSVCDNRGDKGVDGIVVNETTQTITIFGSSIQQDPKSTMGDVKIKELAGTLKQFQNSDALNTLINSAGASKTAALVNRLGLLEKVDNYTVVGEILTNVVADHNGKSFLACCQGEITFVGKDELVSTYISNERDVLAQGSASFDVAGLRLAEYTVDKNTRAVIAPVKASDLAKLSGIADQSLFAYNLRGPLGQTDVNREIAKSISNSELHKKFPLFHNGVTVIAEKVEELPGVLTITNYHVVNGCQSLTALFKNISKISDDLRILAKFVCMDPKSADAKMVTEFSNNQNALKARDFMANNKLQIRLQNEFAEYYEGVYHFDVKRGEAHGSEPIISNEEAGLYLMAVDLREPWGTHRKYQVFDEKHTSLFGRREVTADRIVLCHVIREAVENLTDELTNKLFAKHVLTRYALMYVVGEILDTDTTGKETRTKPHAFVRDENDRAHFRACVERMLHEEVIPEVNSYVEEAVGVGGEEEDFDYRDKLRSEVWVKELRRVVLKEYAKSVAKHRMPTFGEVWMNKPLLTVVGSPAS